MSNILLCDDKDEVIIDIWRGNTETIRGRYKDEAGVYQDLTGSRIVFSATWRDGGLLRRSTDNGAIYLVDLTMWVLKLLPDETRSFPIGLKSVRFEFEIQYWNADNQWQERSRWRGWFNVDGGVNDEGVEPDAGAYTNTQWHFPIYFFSFGEPIDLTGKTFVATLYNSLGASVMQFGGAGPGTIDMSLAALGQIALDATVAQHAGVAAGDYTWQLLETVGPPSPVFWAAGTLKVSGPAGEKTEFKVNTWKDGSQASVWVPSYPPDEGEYLVEDPPLTSFISQDP